MSEDHNQDRAALYKKLHAVMAAVAYIQKDASNTFHGYRYASEAAIKGAVHSALVKHGVVFLMSILDVQEREAAATAKGKPQWITRVVAEYEFTDIDTGYSMTKMFSGQGIDGEDKGIFKAITGCLKYILTSAFLIETGDDPEADDQGQRVKAARNRAIDNASQTVGEGPKGKYDKKQASEAINREAQRLEELLGEKLAKDKLAAIAAELRWNDKMFDDPQAARELFKAIAKAVLEAGDEQSDANPEPAQRKSEPKPQAGKFAYLKEFAAFKKEVGETNYYSAMGVQGFEHADEIPTGKRTEILGRMREGLGVAGAAQQEYPD